MSEEQLDVFSNKMVKHLNRIVPCREIINFYNDDEEKRDLQTFEDMWAEFDKDNFCLWALKDPNVFSVVATVTTLIIFFVIFFCLACFITIIRKTHCGCCNRKPTEAEPEPTRDNPETTPFQTEPLPSGQGMRRNSRNYYNLQSLDDSFL